MESDSNLNIDRRGFVAGVLGIVSGIMGVILGLPEIGYLISPTLKKEKSADWVPLGPVHDLIEGEPTLFTFTRTKQIGWERTGSDMVCTSSRRRVGR